MPHKLAKIITHPRHYLRRGQKLLLWKASTLLGDASFFLQGQMDLNRKSLWHNDGFVKKYGGYHIVGDNVDRVLSPFEPWDNVRRDMLILLLRTIIANNVPGSIAEVGVYQGLTARLIHHFVPDRNLYLFDTFEGFTARGANNEKEITGNEVASSQFSDTSVEAVRTFVNPKTDKVHLIKGYFPDSVPDVIKDEQFAFVHLDADLYEPIYAGLEFFYARMSHHGCCVVHDYNAWPGARRAVDEFMKGKPELVIPMPDKSGSALIIRS